MVAGLEPVVVFWTGWGIHVTVLASFSVQVTLLLLSDIRRRRDWVWLKVVIWSAYMLADTAAIYALGHMSALCNWSPEHQLMALWAPLLLVHLGGQDNITAYAIEDNRLWLRHLQTLVVQVAAAGYVLYVSSILSHPSKLRSAAILMFVVGLVKYGERIWALNHANSCASSILSATSYDKQQQVLGTRTAGGTDLRREVTSWNEELIVAYSLLDVPKQMFEGPTSYVQVNNKLYNEVHGAEFMLSVVKMMYDLLYTKAAVVHSWYGLCSRVLVMLPFTVTALMVFRSSSMRHSVYKRADVAITNVLLVGAVVLETMSVLRAIFSKWTAILMYGRGVRCWSIIGTVLVIAEATVVVLMERLLVGNEAWSGRMRQHNLFNITSHTGYSTGSKMAKAVGREDWWDSNFYSWSTQVPGIVTKKVLELASTPGVDIARSRGLNAIRRSMNNNEELVTRIWATMDELRLEESILVWHIATDVYKVWCFRSILAAAGKIPNQLRDMYTNMIKVLVATEALTNYMFFLLASRPYMLPYPVSRQAYLQLCSDAAASFSSSTTNGHLCDAVVRQKEDLMKGIPLQPDQGIGGQQRQRKNDDDDDDGGTTSTGPHQPSINNTLDKGCQLAANLIHITEHMIPGPEQTAGTLSAKAILDMLLEVWVEMLCYTAYLCNEKSHAKHLTDGGEFMTTITLLMIYMKNGLIRKDTRTSSRRAGSPSSQGAGARGTSSQGTRAGANVSIYSSFFIVLLLYICHPYEIFMI